MIISESRAIEEMRRQRKNIGPSPLARRRPLVVGLTGGVGCGKTVIAREFARRGAVVISGDETGHDVVDQNPGLRKKLAEEFGRDILTKRGINRRKLARRAFANADNRRLLNELVHPALISRTAHASRAI